MGAEVMKVWRARAVPGRGTVRPGTVFRLGMTGMANALGVLKNDTAAMAPILVELELASLGTRDLDGVLIAATLTDLALAGRHRLFFKNVVEFVMYASITS